MAAAQQRPGPVWIWQFSDTSLTVRTDFTYFVLVSVFTMDRPQFSHHNQENFLLVQSTTKKITVNYIQCYYFQERSQHSLIVWIVITNSNTNFKKKNKHTKTTTKNLLGAPFFRRNYNKKLKEEENIDWQFAAKFFFRQKYLEKRFWNFSEINCYGEFTTSVVQF